MDSDGSGHITVDELGDALKKCNIDLPGYQIRDLIVQYDSRIKDGKLDMEEFKQVIITDTCLPKFSSLVLPNSCLRIHVEYMLRCSYM